MPQVLVLLSDYYNIEDIANKPCPFTLFTQAGAIKAVEGSVLSKEKLLNSYIYVDPEKIKPLIPQNEDKTESKKIDSSKNKLVTSEHYEEESTETIQNRLEEIDFEPIPEVKNQLRKNISEIKEIFQKKVIDNVFYLSSKNNKILSKNIYNYLEVILDNHSFSSDYIEMIQSIRNADNYVTFSHGLSVAFYALSIVKKLQMIQNDIMKNNIGKWIPVRTQKNNNKILKTLSIPNQILKYVDFQKQSIEVKYPRSIVQILFERIDDLLYEYGSLDFKQRYPSLERKYDAKTREDLAIAAINCDIGKLLIPNSILNKNEVLTEEDWVILRKHPIYSVGKLKEIDEYSNHTLAYVLVHHNLDNKVGYPIFDKPIPWESKIVTIADMYDAMTSPRHYGRLHTHDEAIAHIRSIYEKGFIDLPLFLAAVHTFEEYNHPYIKQRNKKIKTK